MCFDRHVLGSLLCAGVIALWCAALAVLLYVLNDNIVHNSTKKRKTGGKKRKKNFKKAKKVKKFRNVAQQITLSSAITD